MLARSTLAALACALVTACAKRPPVPPRASPEAALLRLHDALVDPNARVLAVTAPRVIPEAEMLTRMALVHDIQERHPQGFSASGWESAHADLVAMHDEPRTREAFNRTRDLLGNGRCTHAGDASVPETLAPLVASRPSWPAPATALRDALARRTSGARAGTYRCTGSTQTFRAVFIPAEPPDGTLVVAAIAPLAP